MKNYYLMLAVFGFITPNILVIMESLETGNILLYTSPLSTLEGMFANRISSIFVIDLLFALLVFFVWTYNESRNYKIKNIGFLWITTLLFGLAGAFPFFLYLKERHIANQ